MAKKKRAVSADIIVKNYWRDNARFADLFNAVLFHGEPVIRPEELEDEDTEASFVLKRKGKAKGIRQMRDNIKICKHSTARGVEFVMLGHEAQEHVHYAMPMRVMGYDYETYQRQYNEKARKYRAAEDARKEMDGDEFLSGMKRTDRLIPVITLVVYYGEKPWDGATSLHGMLEIGEELAPFVNDYKMLLVEARKNDLKLHNVDNVDLFHLLGIFLDGGRDVAKARADAIAYAKEREVDGEVLQTVAGVTNKTLNDSLLGKKGEEVMCTFFEKLVEEGVEKGLEKGREEGLEKGLEKGREEGLEKGREEGLEKGREEGLARGREEGFEMGRAQEMIDMGLEVGLSEAQIVDKLQRKLRISSQKAEEYFDLFAGQTV